MWRASRSGVWPPNCVTTPDGLLAIADGEHLLRRERLEVEPVGGVVVGGDGLRVAVDHDRLVPERAERLRGVDAAVVELDPLADPVRPRAEDDDPRLRRRSAAPRPPRPRWSRSSSRRPRPRRRRSRHGGRPGEFPARADGDAPPPRSRRAPRRACRHPTPHASRERCRRSPARRARAAISLRNHG